MQNRSIKYTDEFVTRYKELSYGQRILVDGSVEKISSLEDPTLMLGTIWNELVTSVIGVTG